MITDVEVWMLHLLKKYLKYCKLSVDKFKICGIIYKLSRTERQSHQKTFKKLKKAVDPVLMDKYAKKRDNKMYPIVYSVEEHGSNIVCGYCKMEISLSEASKLKAGEVIECATCGRLIYRKK
mgnify:CR=1 FL=1